MQSCLDRLAIPLRVVVVPDSTRKVHGEIEASSGTLFIFDKNEGDAWETFLHEVFEYKLRHVCEGYRLIINSLIEALEKVAYRSKEEFLASIPIALKLVEEERKNEQS
jgi:hypothetical protein